MHGLDVQIETATPQRQTILHPNWYWTILKSDQFCNGQFVTGPEPGNGKKRNFFFFVGLNKLTKSNSEKETHATTVSPFSFLPRWIVGLTFTSQRYRSSDFDSIYIFVRKMLESNENLDEKLWEFPSVEAIFLFFFLLIKSRLRKRWERNHSAYKSMKEA